MTPILLETTFWEVVWWMIMVFFFTMAIWIFISVFADIFRRDDISGWVKAGWIFLIFILPFLGALLYLIFRPKMTEQDKRMLEEYETRQRRMAGEGRQVSRVLRQEGTRLAMIERKDRNHLAVSHQRGPNPRPDVARCLHLHPPRKLACVRNDQRLPGLHQPPHRSGALQLKRQARDLLGQALAQLLIAGLARNAQAAALDQQDRAGVVGHHPCHLLQQPARPLLRRFGPRFRAPGQSGEEDVFKHGTLGQEVMQLKNQTDLPGADRGKLSLAERRQIISRQQHAPAVEMSPVAEHDSW